MQTNENGIKYIRHNENKKRLLSIHWSLKCIILSSKRSSRPEVFWKKDFLKHFTKSIGKQLYQGLLSNKVAGLKLVICM